MKIAKLIQIAGMLAATAVLAGADVATAQAPMPSWTTWLARSKFDPVDANFTRQILHLSDLDKLESEVDLALKLIAYDAGYENASRRRDGLDASGDVDGVADDGAYGRNK